MAARGKHALGPERRGLAGKRHNGVGVHAEGHNRSLRNPRSLRTGKGLRINHKRITWLENLNVLAENSCDLELPSVLMEGNSRNTILIGVGTYPRKYAGYLDPPCDRELCEHLYKMVMDVDGCHYYLDDAFYAPHIGKVKNPEYCLVLRFCAHGIDSLNSSTNWRWNQYVGDPDFMSIKRRIAAAMQMPVNNVWYTSYNTSIATINLNVVSSTANVVSNTANALWLTANTTARDSEPTPRLIKPRKRRRR